MLYLRKPAPRARLLDEAQAAAWLEREDEIHPRESLLALLQYVLLLGGAWGLLIGWVV